MVLEHTVYFIKVQERLKHGYEHVIMLLCYYAIMILIDPCLHVRWLAQERASQTLSDARMMKCFF